MKKVLFSALALTALAGSSHALQANGAIWSGKGCQGETDGTFEYCVGRITSVTTVASIGRIGINPAGKISIIGTNSGTVSGVVTPTATFFLGNQAVAQQTVSLTTTGNRVDVAVPYFDSMSVSISVPSLLGTSQSAIISVIENRQ